MDKTLLFALILAASPVFAADRAPELPDLQSLLSAQTSSLSADSFPEDIDAEPAARGPEKDHAAFDPARLAGDYKLVSCQKSGDDLSNAALPEGVPTVPHGDISLDAKSGELNALIGAVNAPESKRHDASPHMSGARRDKNVETYSFKDGVVQRFRLDERAALIYRIYWDHFDTVVTLDGGKLVIEQWRDYGFRFPLDGKTRRFAGRERCEFAKQ